METTDAAAAAPVRAETAPLTMPGNVKVARVPDEDCFPMPRRHWHRLRERVGQLSDPLAHSGNLAWTCIGVAASGALTFVPWLAAYSQLDRDGKLAFAWIAPVIGVATVAAGALAAYAFWIGSRLQEVRKRSTTQIGDDMDMIYEPFRQVSVQTTATRDAASHPALPGMGDNVRQAWCEWRRAGGNGRWNDETAASFVPYARQRGLSVINYTSGPVTTEEVDEWAGCPEVGNARQDE